jgi:hypothetical protein
VKAGMPWEEALKRRFGTDVPALARTVESWHRPADAAP